MIFVSFDHEQVEYKEVDVPVSTVSDEDNGSGDSKKDKEKLAQVPPLTAKTEIAVPEVEVAEDSDHNDDPTGWYEFSACQWLDL